MRCVLLSLRLVLLTALLSWTGAAPGHAAAMALGGCGATMDPPPQAQSQTQDRGHGHDHGDDRLPLHGTETCALHCLQPMPSTPPAALIRAGAVVRDLAPWRPEPHPEAWIITPEGPPPRL